MNSHRTKFGAANGLGGHILMAVALLLVSSFTLPTPAVAATLGADKLALFPKETGEFGYADLKLSLIHI